MASTQEMVELHIGVILCKYQHTFSRWNWSLMYLSRLVSSIGEEILHYFHVEVDDGYLQRCMFGILQEEETYYILNITG